METNYKSPTWEERLAEVREAKRKLLRGNPADAIDIIIRRIPYWDEDYIDEEWFLEVLEKEEQFILDEPKRGKEIKEEWDKYYDKDNDPFATFEIKDNHKIEF